MIVAPPDVVFRTLITPSLVDVWFDGKGSVIEPRVGGRYSINWRYTVDGREFDAGPTRILEYIENELLTLDWMDWRGDISVQPQTISFRLERVDDKTRVTFVHAGFERTADIGDYLFGWSEYTTKLREAVMART